MVTLTSIATAAVSISVTLAAGIAAALALRCSARRPFAGRALRKGAFRLRTIAVTFARTARRSSVVVGGTEVLALLAFARCRGHRGLGTELRRLEFRAVARLEVGGPLALPEFLPSIVGASLPRIRPAAVLRSDRVAATVLSAGVVRRALIGSSAATVRPTAPIAAAPAAVPALAATVATSAVLATAVLATAVLAAAVLAAAVLATGMLSAASLATAAMALILFARLVAVVIGLEHLQELRRDVLAQKQRLAVVEVVAFLPGIEREDPQHGVVAPGPATGLARVVDVEREVQETPATPAQSVARRAIGVARVDADVEEFRRLRRLTGLDLDRVAVQRAHAAVAQLVPRPVTGHDRFFEIAFVDRLAEALVERTHDVGDCPESVTVELQAKAVRLVPEHVRQRASDALDQRGMGHEELCKAHKRDGVAKVKTGVSSAFERDPARSPSATSELFRT